MGEWEEGQINKQSLSGWVGKQTTIVSRNFNAYSRILQISSYLNIVKLYTVYYFILYLL